MYVILQVLWAIGDDGKYSQSHNFSLLNVIIYSKFSKENTGIWDDSAHINKIFINVVLWKHNFAYI